MTRTILVTGGAGFIGSALLARLTAAGDRVRALDNLSVGSRRYLDGLAPGQVELVEGSLADRALVRRAVEGCDAIVHLAARAGIPDSIVDPLKTFEANATETVELLEAGRLAGAGRFVFASSNAVLGDAIPPFDEETPARPTTPYGASKLAGEAYCGAYAATYDLATCVLRFSNVYGPRSLHKKSVVAAWLRATRDGGAITVDGTGDQTRDFIYVEDLAEGIQLALDAAHEAVSGQVFQVGTGVETSVLELAHAVRDARALDIEIVHRPARQGDALRNVSRVDKAAERLGFRARTSLAEGLRRTVEWFDQALADPDLAAIQPAATSGSD